MRKSNLGGPSTILLLLAASTSALGQVHPAPARPANASPPDSIRLHALYSWPLQSPSGVKGAVVSNDGRVVYWGNGVALVSREQSRVIELCPGRVSSAIAVAFVGDSSIEILDAATAVARIFSLDYRHVCHQRFETVLESGTRPVAAARMRSGWVMSVTGEDTVSEVISLNANGSAGWSVRNVQSQGQDADHTYLGVSGETILVSSMLWPFRTTLVAGDGQVTATFDAQSAADTTSREWIALPPVGIVGGFMQTLANPRSDRRLIILMNQRGKVLRGTEINTALGTWAVRQMGGCWWR